MSLFLMDILRVTNKDSVHPDADLLHADYQEEEEVTSFSSTQKLQLRYD